MRRLPGSKLAGAHTIIAVDIDDRKLEWAKGFGATHTVNSREVDAVEAIQNITGGNGADVCVSRRLDCRRLMSRRFSRGILAGTVVLVGVPSPEMMIELPMIEVFGRGGSVEVVVVRGLSADAGLPDVHRPLHAGSSWIWMGSCRRRSG